MLSSQNLMHFLSLILCRSMLMGSNSVVDMIEASSGVHFSGFHMDGLEQRLKIEPPTTSNENMHKQPFVIGKYWFMV